MDRYEFFEKRSHGCDGKVFYLTDSWAEPAAVIDNVDDPMAVGEFPTVKLPQAIRMISLPFDPMDAFIFDLATSREPVRFDDVTIRAFGEWIGKAVL